MSNITIIGGGNMGSVLAVKFSQNNNVTLFLNSPYEKIEEYSKSMKLYNEERDEYSTGKILRITDDLEKAVSNAEWIFVTFPSFLFEDLAKKLVPLLRSGQHIVGIPGSGGFELFFKDAIAKGVTITGLQRTHSVARVIEKGKLVRESGVREEIHCASIPSEFNSEAAIFLEKNYSVKTVKLKNYLNITLINSNPILHTSRLYDIFNEFESVKEYDSVPLFYEEWSIKSSELLNKMDRELFSAISLLKQYFDISEITTLLEHYESSNIEEMTAKLRSIRSLKGLKMPTKFNENGKLVPDLSSRYFMADFPLGLDILLSFCRALKIEANEMQNVSNWYHRITQTNVRFNLKNFNISGIDDLIKFYLT